MTMRTDVAVVGGGVIGLACAWRLAQAGVDVAVVDPAPGSGASHAAAGMLAPVTEVHYGEEPLLALNLESARRWPVFAAELEATTGIEVGYRSDGVLAVGLDDDDLRTLDHIRRFQHSLGLDVQRLDRRSCRSREPWLSPRVRGGVLASGDNQVDPRLTVVALVAAVEQARATIVREPVVGVAMDGSRVTGVETATETISCGTVVVAAGAWSRTIAGIPSGVLPPVRPVKGQILRLRFDPLDPPLRGTVRGLASGRPVYLVPRTSGELVIGATVEEAGFDTTTTAGGLYELLRAASELFPGISELELMEASAGLRPGTPDNAPVLGHTDLEGLVVATGHYRNGVLLAPVTAEVVCAAVTARPIPPVAAPFQPRRFRPCA